MSYSSNLDPFQNNINSTSNSHSRQPSLPTVYKENDPYRIIKKGPQIGSISDESEFDAVHSRTASDSSTSKLYTGAMALPSNSNDYEDPYAKSQYKKHRNSTAMNDRANSYLPYSHHPRDPDQKAEPIYIEEYTAPTSTSLGVGSMLQDNAIDQINMRNSQQPTTNSIPDYIDKMSDLPEITKRRRQKRRLCGLRYRTVAFIVFLCIAVIVVIWYFVWPRIPVFALDDVDNVGNIQVITNTTKKSMSTNWMLNFTADNSVNWVPTRFSSIDLNIIDDKTQESFGNGTKGSFVLPAGKTSSVAIPMNIYYASEIMNDTTFQDLYNACGVQVTSNSPFNNQQNSLNVTLFLTYHIAGIVWPTTKSIPIKGLICPVT